MEKQIRNNDKKDAEYWKRLASRLALALAVLILVSGVAGLWMSSEKRALDSFRHRNKFLKNLNRNAAEKLIAKTKELKECELETKNLTELNKSLIDANSESEKDNTTLDSDYDKVDEALTATIDERDELLTKNKKLKQEILDLTAENTALKASFDK
jgi:DNA repair exonuclease SbcCD ATPase subunit